MLKIKSFFNHLCRKRRLTTLNLHQRVHHRYHNHNYYYLISNLNRRTQLKMSNYLYFIFFLNICIFIFLITIFIYKKGIKFYSIMKREYYHLKQNKKK